METKGGLRALRDRIAEDRELADLEAEIAGMDEAALDAFAAEIDERMSTSALRRGTEAQQNDDIMRRFSKKRYKKASFEKTKQRADAFVGMARALSSYSTKKLMKMLKNPNTASETKKDIMMMLRMRIAKGRSGKLKLRAK